MPDFLHIHPVLLSEILLSLLGLLRRPNMDYFNLGTRTCGDMSIV